MMKKIFSILTALSISMICLVGCGERGSDVYDAYTSIDLKTSELIELGKGVADKTGETVSFIACIEEIDENGVLKKVSASTYAFDPKDTLFVGRGSEALFDVYYDKEVFSDIDFKSLKDDDLINNAHSVGIVGEITDADESEVPVIEVQRFYPCKEYKDMAAINKVFENDPSELDKLDINAVNPFDKATMENADQKKVNLIMESIKKRQGKISDIIHSVFVDKNGDYWLVVKTDTGLGNGVSVFFIPSGDGDIEVKAEDINPYESIYK